MVPRSHDWRVVHFLLSGAVFIALNAVLAAAQGAKVETVGSLIAPGASEELRTAVAENGTRITLEDGSTVEFWFARALAVSGGGEAGALYPYLANGEFVGVVTFPKGASDLRGQAIAAGTYTLRYQSLPQDANHMGVSPNPDFLLTIPIAADTTAPADNLPLKRLVVLSGKSTGTAHPGVFALAPAGTPNNVAKDDQGMVIYTAEIATSAGKSEKIGIVIKGQATQ